MKFKITRSSLWDDKIKPCEEAYSEIKDDDTYWFIDIHSINDLLNLIEKYNHAIIIDDIYKKECGCYEIEIYDDYRE